MTWLSENELEGLRNNGYNIGKNVKISSNAEINCSQLEIGDNSRIDSFTFLSGKIKLGRYCHIGTHNTWSGGNEIIVGDFCGFSSHIFLYTNDANYNNESLSLPTVPKKYKRKTFGGSITIDDHVIIGAQSVISPNTHIQIGSKFGSFSNISGNYATGLHVGSNKYARFKKPLTTYYLIKDSKEL